MKSIASLTDKKTWERGIRHLKRKDRVLASVIDGVGPYGKFKTYSDYYGTLVEWIVFQQLTGKAAESILFKFKRLYNGRIPEPSEFLLTAEKKVRGTGISPQKYLYIKDLCTRMRKGVLELEEMRMMPNEQVIKTLDEVRGIGMWTAEMFLIFSLARTDVFPMGDLGIRKAVQKTYSLSSLPNRKMLEELAERWHPYESIATLYLWKSQD